MTPARAGAWAIVVAAGASAFAASRLPAPAAALVLAVTFLLAPGRLAVRALWPAADPETRALGTFALSPFVAGAPFALLVWLGVPARPAATAVACAIGIAALFAALSAERADARPAAPSRARPAWLVAGLWTLVVAALFAGNPWLAPRSDGWFHAAVTRQIAARGLPPEDPYWAGLRLLYFWGADAWAAAWLALAPRLAVWTPLVLFDVAAAFAAAIGVAALARALGASARGAAGAVALAIAGYAPFAWVQVAGRAIVGEVRGPAELSRLVHAGADALLGLLAIGQVHASLAFFGDKFLVPTSFGMGLALLAFVLLALLALEREPGPRAAAVLALALAATLFTHTVIGDALLLACALWGAVRAWDAVRGDPLARGRLVAGALAGLAALAATAPYLAEITLGKHGQLAGSRGALSGRSFLLGGALFVPAGFAWCAARARAHAGARLVLVTAGLFAVLALALKLPENNQSKFFNLLWLVLAAPAAAGLGALGARLSPAARVAGAGLLVAATAPTLALAIAAFALERGQSPSAWSAWRAGAPEAPALAWIGAHTSPDAAFCDVGGARDLVAVAGRAVVWGGRTGERDWGYAPEALETRRELVTALCSGREPGPRARALERSLARPLYVVVRAADDSAAARRAALTARPGRFEPVFDGGAMALWRVRSGQ